MKKKVVHITAWAKMMSLILCQVDPGIFLTSPESFREQNMKNVTMLINIFHFLSKADV